MSRRDFLKAAARQNVAARGSEPVDGGNLLFAAPRQRKPKAESRQEASSLMSPSSMVTKIIECPCGHKGKVRIPMARVAGPFRCVICGGIVS